MAIGIGVIAVVDAIAILLAFVFGMQRYPGHLEAAQTIAFVTLCTSELIRAYTARSEYHSMFSIGVFSNKWMNWAVLASFLLVLAVVYVPFLQPFFDTVPLTLDDWLFMFPFFFASPIAMELLKVYFRSRTATATEAMQARLQRGLAADGPQSEPAQSLERPNRAVGAVKRILVPVDGTPNSGHAVRHAVNQFMSHPGLEIHLLNVQPPFSQYIARFVSRKNLAGHHRDEAERATRPARDLLDRFGVPYARHTEIGDKAAVISQVAHRLRCDRIVMGTARKNSLTRLVEDSVTNKVLELAEVPVEVIVGDAISPYERYGIPAAIGTAIAFLLMAVAD
jgi:nucleotide-binding universal stress UspA family protein